MIFYASSTDPDNYQTVKLSTNTIASNENLEFRVNQLSTTATFLITTADDFITFQKSGSLPLTFTFQERYKYDREILAIELTKIFNDEFIVSDNSNGALSIKSTDNTEFKIINASHRVKLLLGLYHTDLPTLPTKELKIKSVPFVCYGNNLYLRSRISNIVGFSDIGDKNIYLSIVYHVYEILYPNMPVICRNQGKATKIKPSDLTNLEFTLVDFQNEPVLLKAPLSLVLEVNFIN